MIPSSHVKLGTRCPSKILKLILTAHRSSTEEYLDSAGDTDRNPATNMNLLNIVLQVMKSLETGLNCWTDEVLRNRNRPVSKNPISELMDSCFNCDCTENLNRTPKTCIYKNYDIYIFIYECLHVISKVILKYSNSMKILNIVAGKDRLKQAKRSMRRMMATIQNDLSTSPTVVRMLSMKYHNHYERFIFSILNHIITEVAAQLKQIILTSCPKSRCPEIRNDDSPTAGIVQGNFENQNCKESKTDACRSTNCLHKTSGSGNVVNCFYCLSGYKDREILVKTISKFAEEIKRELIVNHKRGFCSRQGWHNSNACGFKEEIDETGINLPVAKQYCDVCRKLCRYAGSDRGRLLFEQLCAQKTRPNCPNAAGKLHREMIETTRRFSSDSGLVCQHRQMNTAKSQILNQGVQVMLVEECAVFGTPSDNQSSSASSTPLETSPIASENTAQKQKTKSVHGNTEKLKKSKKANEQAAGNKSKNPPAPTKTQNEPATIDDHQEPRGFESKTSFPLEDHLSPLPTQLSSSTDDSYSHLKKEDLTYTRTGDRVQDGSRTEENTQVRPNPPTVHDESKNKENQQRVVCCKCEETVHAPVFIASCSCKESTMQAINSSSRQPIFQFFTSPYAPCSCKQPNSTEGNPQPTSISDHKRGANLPQTTNSETQTSEMNWHPSTTAQAFPKSQTVTGSVTSIKPSQSLLNNKLESVPSIEESCNEPSDESQPLTLCPQEDEIPSAENSTDASQSKNCRSAGDESACSRKIEQIFDDFDKRYSKVIEEIKELCNQGYIPMKKLSSDPSTPLLCHCADNIAKPRSNEKIPPQQTQPHSSEVSSGQIVSERRFSDTSGSKNQLVSEGEPELDPKPSNQQCTPVYQEKTANDGRNVGPDIDTLKKLVEEGKIFAHCPCCKCNESVHDTDFHSLELRTTDQTDKLTNQQQNQAPSGVSVKKINSCEKSPCDELATDWPKKKTVHLTNPSESSLPPKTFSELLPSASASTGLSPEPTVFVYSPHSNQSQIKSETSSRRCTCPNNYKVRNDRGEIENIVESIYSGKSRELNFSGQDSKTEKGLVKSDDSMEKKYRENDGDSNTNSSKTYQRQNSNEEPHYDEVPQKDNFTGHEEDNASTASKESSSSPSPCRDASSKKGITKNTTAERRDPFSDESLRNSNADGTESGERAKHSTSGKGEDHNGNGTFARATSDYYSSSSGRSRRPGDDNETPASQSRHSENGEDHRENNLSKPASKKVKQYPENADEESKEIKQRQGTNSDRSLASKPGGKNIHQYGETSAEDLPYNAGSTLGSPTNEETDDRDDNSKTLPHTVAGGKSNVHSSIRNPNLREVSAENEDPNHQQASRNIQYNGETSEQSNAARSNKATINNQERRSPVQNDLRVGQHDPGTEKEWESLYQSRENVSRATKAGESSQESKHDRAESSRHRNCDDHRSGERNKACDDPEDSSPCDTNDEDSTGSIISECKELLETMPCYYPESCDTDSAFNQKVNMLIIIDPTNRDHSNSRNSNTVVNLDIATTKYKRQASCKIKSRNELKSPNGNEGSSHFTARRKSSSKSKKPANLWDWYTEGLFNPQFPSLSTSKSSKIPEKGSLEDNNLLECIFLNHNVKSESEEDQFGRRGSHFQFDRSMENRSANDDTISLNMNIRTSGPKKSFKIGNTPSVEETLSRYLGLRGFWKHFSENELCVPNFAEYLGML